MLRRLACLAFLACGPFMLYGTALSQGTAPPPGALPPSLPGYDGLRWLGRGGFADVWLSRHIELDQQRARVALAPPLPCPAVVPAPRIIEAVPRPPRPPRPVGGAWPVATALIRVVTPAVSGC